MPLEPPRFAWRSHRRTLFALAAVYVHFLLFAQFGFLAQLQDRLQGAAAVQTAMAWMGAAGLLASFASVAAVRRWGAPRLVRPALVACATVAFLSPAAVAPAELYLTAAAVGSSVGVATVALAASLRDLVPAATVGRTAGVATGAAYLLSNLPLLFAAPPIVRAWAPAALCLAAAVWAPRARQEDAEDLGPGLDRRWFGAAGAALVVVAFAALVGLDSAAFAYLQTNPALEAITWGGAGRQLLQGAVHLAAAAAAGLLLDRRRFASLLAATAALFAVAFALLAHGLGDGSIWRFVTVVYAGPLYAVGISFYSTALVAYPSLAGDAAGLVPRRWRAALLFGLSGWLGSALGVGAAQEIGGLPVRPAVAAAFALPLLFLALRSGGLGRLARVAALAALLAAAGWAVDGLVSPPTAAGAADPDAAAVARGRRVYVAEGCIHCHSQYVRPDAGHDLAWWGPHRPLDRTARPPLVGNRRQGPDLSNAGNRRSPLWHRLHLADPRALDPASRMPSYAHLFTGGGQRGDDLVVYLASLGAGTPRPDGSPAYAAAGSAERGRRLFATWCAVCHGAAGRGDGPLAERFGRPAMDLGKPAFWAVSWGAGQEPLERGLARVIRHGIAGTSMPGREYLRDQEVADLAAWVATLPGRGAP